MTLDTHCTRFLRRRAGAEQRAGRTVADSVSGAASPPATPRGVH
jgi:hypothetical protein